MIFDLQVLSAAEKQYFLQHVIAPRPVCFASTIDKAGNVNLSPFSFFNLFSTSPPVVIFSPVKRLRDGSTKHTLQNIFEVPEVVINIVTYDMVQQMSLSSCDYPKGTDEFIKSGFTKEPATTVKPPMVLESKAKLECKVLEVKSLGDGAGAGQLVICEILKLHLDNSLLDESKKFIQSNLELVARLGGDYYCHVSKENLFIVPKPNVKLGIGLDALPKSIRNSKVLTGNHLGLLAGLEAVPVSNAEFHNEQVNVMLRNFAGNKSLLRDEMHRYAATLLDENKVNEAWQIVLALEDWV